MKLALVTHAEHPKLRGTFPDIWPAFMGMVTASHPAKALEPDWVPPVVAQRPPPIG